MTWKRTALESVYSRPMGENEKFLKLAGDAGLHLPQELKREHWAINFTATIAPAGSFASADLAALFRRAWAHLRFQHPSLAVEVDPADAGSLIYTVPADGVALDAWVDRTFSVAANAGSSADVIPTFQPSPYAKLVWVPQSGELLGHTAHWRSDGIGVLQLLSAFLAFASQPTLTEPASLAWGTEVVRLTPCVEDAAAMPAESTPELQARTAKLMGRFAHAAGALGIPSLGDAATLPAGTRRALLTFTREETSEIVAACKRLGVSVTAAVHASVAGANYALADATDRETKHYTSTVRFGLRPYLPVPSSISSFAAGLYTTGWMTRVEPHMSWAERLQSYAEEYKKGITREFLDAHREYAVQLGATIRSSKPVAPPPSDIDISSIGLGHKMVQIFYGTTQAGFEVKAISVGIEMLSRQGVTFVWTFREQLNLSLNYNESYHSAEQMEDFVRTVRLQLLEGLFPGGN